MVCMQRDETNTAEHPAPCPWFAFVDVVGEFIGTNSGLRPPRCVSSGPVVVRLAEKTNVVVNGANSLP